MSKQPRVACFGWAIVAFALTLSGCAERVANRQIIEQMLNHQAEDWNRGDIVAFMQPYWKSEDLTFSSGGQTRHGWDETLRRYQERYPTKEHMGALKFELERFQPLSEQAMLVLGRWRLTRAMGDIGGNFTLVLQRINGEWRIVHDHTSTDSQ